MNILIKNVEAEIQEELKRANEKFPLFHSDHEGLAVLEEEVTEANDEMKILESYFSSFKDAIFSDMNDDILMRYLDYMRHNALNSACELIQVAAMADKFILSKNEREKQK